MANVNTINLEMRDVVRFAEQLAIVCPRLRQLRISATYFGLWGLQDRRRTCALQLEMDLGHGTQLLLVSSDQAAKRP